MTIRTRAGRDLLGWRGNHATWTERRWVEAIEAIELEAVRQHELLGPTIVVWLIERGQSEGYASPIYYADRETQVKSLRHDPAWTRDAYRAMRFPTKEAALTFMESQRDGDRSMPGRPVEHGFIEAASPDTGVAEGAGLDAPRKVYEVRWDDDEAYHVAGRFTDKAKAERLMERLVAAHMAADHDDCHFEGSWSVWDEPIDNIDPEVPFPADLFETYDEHGEVNTDRLPLATPAPEGEPKP